MSDTIDFMSRKRPLPLLTRSNHREWFRTLTRHLEGEGTIFTLEITLEDYAETQEIADAFATLTIDGKPKPPPKPATIKLSPEKVKEWKKADGKNKYVIDICIDEFDKEDTADEQTALAMLEILKKKYKDTDEAFGSSKLTELTHYVMGENATIDEAWTQLRKLRREVVELKPQASTLFTQEELFQRLLEALPSEYLTVRDTLRSQLGLTVDSKLEVLRRKEKDLKGDSAMAAYSKGFQTRQQRSSRQSSRQPSYKKDSPRRRNSSSSSKGSSGSGNYQRKCYLCKGEHMVRNCPYRDYAAKAASRERKRAEEDKPKKDHRRKEKSLRKPGKKYHKGYHVDDLGSSEDSTESESTTEDDECANFSKEDASKTPHSRWVADTGASTHMTDQLQLFRGDLIPIKRRTIKVPGGRMYASQSGTVKLKVKGGNSMLLEHVLYVPNIGASLLSGRRMCRGEFTGGFTADKWYIMNNSGHKVLEASGSNGIYLVDWIADGLQETAFTAGYIPDEPCAFLDEVQPGDESSEPELSTTAKETYQLWHRRLAHLGSAKIGKLHEVSTLKKPIKVPTKRDICQVCCLTKSRDKINRKLSPRKDGPLDQISIDIAGPFPTSMNGNRVFLEIVDNHTRKVWVIPLPTRDAAIEALKRWKLSTELETGRKLKAVKSDNAGELKLVIDKWCHEYGLKPEYTIPYTSHQNGLAERNIQTTENSVRAMIKEADLPLEFWDEAATTDAYIRNRVATGPEVKEKRVSPEEAYTGQIPSLDHIRVWGHKCYSHVKPESLPQTGRRDKFMDRGRVGVFMGYTETTAQLKMWAPDLGRIIRTNTIVVDESIKGGTVDLKLRLGNSQTDPKTSLGNSQGTRNELPVRRPRGRPKKVNEIPQPATSEVKDTTVHEDDEVMEIVRGSSLQQDTLQRGGDDQMKIVQEPPLPQGGRKVMLRVEVPRREVEGPGPQLPKGDQNQPHEATEHTGPITRSHGKKRALSIDDDTESQKSKTTRMFMAMAASEHFKEEPPIKAAPKERISVPKTYEEAVNDPKHGDKWMISMNKEEFEVDANGTFEVVDMPQNTNIVSSKWVYAVKYDVDGNLERLKARIVARGFTQVHGEDFWETFAPTMRMDTLRIFLAITAMEDLECHQVDVNNAFTESTLQETIYMHPPKGVHLPNGKVYRVRKSLYGLKQAARDWYKTCSKELLKMGFEQSSADPCLFTIRDKGLIVLVYVDDISIAAPKLEDIKWFKRQLSATFKIKDLGEISKILGMRVTRDRKNRKITLDQTSYLEGVLHELGMPVPPHKPLSLPINGYEALKPTLPDDERADIEEYQSIVGKLIFAMIYSRIDIAFALGKLSQYMANPAKRHAQALRRLLRYVSSTKDAYIEYKAGKDTHLVGYTDADWGSDTTDRKSTSGQVFMLGGGPVSWASRKQKSVTTSSTESEYIAMSSCAKQAVWISQILRDMSMAKHLGSNPYCTQIMGDNQGSIHLLENPRIHERSKHIDICYHHVRDLAARKRIKVDYIPTDEMLADGLTKPLTSVKFKKFTEMVGLRGLDKVKVKSDTF